MAEVSEALHVRIVGGSFHETDSNETSYFIAAGAAFQDAVRRASANHAG